MHDGESWPRPARWSFADCVRMGDSGLFDRRAVMLVGGRILERPRIDPRTACAFGLGRDAYLKAFGPRFVCRQRSPLVLAEDTDPEPDLAVVPGSPRDYPDHQRTAVLVAEVSDSTLRFDLGDKSSLYAAGGILDYWVIDLNGRQLVVHRDPVADAAWPFGWRYATVTKHAETVIVQPLAAQGLVAVADLLP